MDIDVSPYVHLPKSGCCFILLGQPLLKLCVCNHRQSTIDCQYLILLCDNLKMRMFLHQNFFPDTILGICNVFPVIHCDSTIIQPNNFIMG
jgi:hypothetical protein